MYENLVHPEDTIVEIAIAQGVGAIGIIRVSGDRAFPIVQSVFKGKLLADQTSHTIHYGHIVDGNSIVDEVMVSIFKSPKSFTTEDSVEITCHGSMYIQSEIVRLLLKNGARLAAPGEFTLRAYLNGRIDLAQAEAVGDIIASQNSSQLDLALNQMRGGLSRKLNELREQLLNFISLIELELDFGEEDVEFADRAELEKRMREMMLFIEPIINSFRLGNAIKNGIPVAIVGRPNAGKSSLLNALLEDDRAIVSDIAGTTRDTIEEEIHIKGISFRFIDTAGIRQTEDVIEKIGIEKAKQSIQKSNLVLYIFDLSELSTQELQNDILMIQAHNPKAKLIVIANKSDKVDKDKLSSIEKFLGEEKTTYLTISLRSNIQSDLESLREILYAQMQLETVGDQSTIISNLRHHDALKNSYESLASALALLPTKTSGDILSFELRRAIEAIGSITGTISNDEVLGNIFGKFCIGK
ncbi:MAG: tRNA uridine-5-carboxymethylaminomethyl(34) synthesis GTPase MnmE [Bacteroidia bacterium]|nr:tRNA uridine-5-carboxymethylaminomethyl(34) synthesis GTPase MnmE [Bacteroidia bacterium]